MVKIFFWFCLMLLAPVFTSQAASGQTVGSQCHLVRQGNSERPLKILYFIPGKETQEYWQMHIGFLRAVALALGIDLDLQMIKSVDKNRFHFNKLVKKQLQMKQPDYVVAPLFRGGEAALLKTIEALAIPLLSVNSSLNKSQFETLGLPRQKYRYWLGHVSADSFAIGHDLAQALIRLTQGAGPATMMAIAGTTKSTISRDREQGLLAAIKQQTGNPPAVKLLPIIHTDWSRAAADAATHRVLKRGLAVDQVWTVGADSAAGVVDALLSRRLVPGKDIRVGTIDWSPTAIELIKKGHVEMSIGGHFMEGGWALILLLDHANKMDYAAELGLTVTTQLQALTKHNLARFSEAIIKQDWAAFDFKPLSKCFNRQRKSYDFNLDILRATP